MSKTHFSDKCIILHDLYLEHHDDPEWEDFFYMNDLGVPLAIALNMGGAVPNDMGIAWIDDAFASMCEALGIEDTGFSTIDEMMEAGYAEG